MKAYVITNDDEASTVFFAEDAKGAAEQWVEENFGACDGCSLKVFASVSKHAGRYDRYAKCECHTVDVVREPRFDQYADTQKVPVEAYHRAWWAHVCQECEKHAHWGSEPCGPGDWRVVNGRALCTECADHEEKTAA